MLGKISVIAAVVALAFAGAWAAERYGLREPYSSLVVEFLGAAVVAILTWALVSVPKRKQLFVELKHNHIQLLGIWKLGPKLDDSGLFLLRHTISLQRGLFASLDGFGLTALLKEYDEKLTALIRVQEEKVLKEVDGYKIWGPSFTTPWNECHKAFAGLMKRISFWGYSRIWRERERYVLDAAADRWKPLPSPRFEAERGAAREQGSHS